MITIIVLLILAGVTVVTLTGENGLLNRTSIAKEETLIAQYKEKIELVKAETRVEYKGEVTLENLKNNFNKDSQKSWVNKVEIIEDNEIEKIKLTTNDGYIFYITENTTEYQETEIGTTKIPTAEEISFTPKSELNWNVNNVKDALDDLFDKLN